MRKLKEVGGRGGLGNEARSGGEVDEVCRGLVSHH